MLSVPSTYVLKPAMAVPSASTPRPSVAHGVPDEPALQEADASPAPMRHVVSQRGNAWFFHDVARISRFFSAHKYTCFVQDGIEHICTESLTSLEARLAPLGFLRTHRADLVNTGHVQTVRRVRHSFELTLKDGQRVLVSRRLVKRLRQTLAF